MKIADRKKILVLVDWFYPGYKAGGPIQSCRNFIKAMEEDFDISVITSDRDMGDTRAYPGVSINQWNRYSGRTRVFYATALSIKHLQILCREVNADYIYINSMFSPRFAIYPLWLIYSNKIKSRMVLAPRGMLHEGALKFKPKKKQFVLWLIKQSGAQKKITFHATDAQELTDIRSYFPMAKDIKLATNFPRMQQPGFEPAEKKTGELKCVFISRISPKKNIHYLLRLLSELSPGLSITLEIWGEPEDKDYWHQCMALIAKLPSFITVHVKGPVENDAIPELLKRYHLFVLPTLGENFGHAIFDALLAGRPVLISDKTPWHGLAERKAGWDLSLQNEESFINALEKAAAMEAVEWNEWCRGAWQLANEFITQTDIRHQYLQLFN